MGLQAAPRRAHLIFFVLAGCTGFVELDIDGRGAGDTPSSAPEAELLPPSLQACEPPAPAAVPMRRLTRSYVEQAVQDVLGVVEPLPVSDEQLFTYRSNISGIVDVATAQAYLSYAEKVADTASLVRCTPSGCKPWLLDEVGRRLFRRPLEGALRDRYASLYDQGLAEEGSPAGAARWVLQAMLQSPAFLYLDEPVGADGLLDGYAVAARLALMFWNASPDDALLDAAARGELGTVNGVRSAARAMLADPRSQRGLRAFVSDWLRLEKLRRSDARPDLAALGEPTLAALEQEPVELFRRAVADNGGLPQLFTTSRTSPLPALSAIYGSDIVGSSASDVALDPAKRAGLLTLPGVMAALAHAGGTSPTLRGHAILSDVLCAPPPPPPAGVEVTLPEVDPNATTRERLAVHVSSPACASCHRAMDNIGFAFERYDALGRWRELEKGKPIDDHAELSFGSDTISVKGGVALSAALAERPEVQRCVTTQWVRYAGGVPEPSSLSCVVQALAERAKAPGGLQEMMIDLAASGYLRAGAAP